MLQLVAALLLVWLVAKQLQHPPSPQHRPHRCSCQHSHHDVHQHDSRLVSSGSGAQGLREQRIGPVPRRSEEERQWLEVSGWADGQDSLVTSVSGSETVTIDRFRRTVSRDRPPHFDQLKDWKGAGPGHDAQAYDAAAVKAGTERRHSPSFWCKPCARRFGSEAARNQHNVDKHFSDIALTGSKWYNLPPAEEGGPPRATCDICRHESDNAFFDRQHKAHKHPWVLFCANCNVAFGNTHAAKGHYHNVHKLRRDSSPRLAGLVMNENNYTVVEGIEPDPNLPELQQTYGCAKCPQRFTTAAERDDHLASPFAHGDETGLQAAFPPLSARSPSRTPPPAKELEDTQPSAVTRINALLDVIHSGSTRFTASPNLRPDPAEHRSVTLSSSIAFDQELPNFALTLESALGAGATGNIHSGNHSTLGYTADLASSNDSLAEQTVPSITASTEPSSPEVPATPGSPSVSTGEIGSPSIASDESDLWAESKRPKLAQDEPIDGDAAIKWGEFAPDPVVPGPEFFPPLPASAKAEQPEIEPQSLVDLESTAQPIMSSHADAIQKASVMVNRWSQGERPRFTLPVIAGSGQASSDLSNPTRSHRPHPSRFARWDEPDHQPDDEPVVLDYDAPAPVSGTNDIPVSARRSASNHYRLPDSQAPDGATPRRFSTSQALRADSGLHQHPIAQQGPRSDRQHVVAAEIEAAFHLPAFAPAFDMTTTYYAPQPMHGAIEEQLPLFDMPASHEESAGFQVREPTALGPRPAPVKGALSAWSTPMTSCLNPSARTYHPYNPRSWGSTATPATSEKLPSSDQASRRPRTTSGASARGSTGSGSGSEPRSKTSKMKPRGEIRFQTVLQPQYEDEWQTVSAAPSTKTSRGGRPAQRETFAARQMREARERDAVVAAAGAPDEDDPYGGW